MPLAPTLELGNAVSVPFSVQNTSAVAATNVVVHAKASGGLGFTDAQAPGVACQVSPLEITCNAPALAPNASVTITFVVSPELAGPAAVDLSATALEPDPDPSNNTARYDVTLVDASDGDPNAGNLAVSNTGKKHGCDAAPGSAVAWLCVALILCARRLRGTRSRR
jgi:hypothetical protein